MWFLNPVFWEIVLIFSLSTIIYFIFVYNSKESKIKRNYKKLDKYRSKSLSRFCK